MLALFGGALRRDSDGSWKWRDGTSEPRVRDVRPWAFHQTEIDGRLYVEVLRSMAERDRSLDWVWDGARKGLYPTSDSTNHTAPLKHFDRNWYRAYTVMGEDPLMNTEPQAEDLGLIPRVVLVPLADWEKWASSALLGVEWNPEHHAEILDRARELGWRG